jgi:hypothetical protein
MIRAPTVARRLVVADLLSELRAACAAVAQRARHVSIDRRAISAYARSLPPDRPPATAGDKDHLRSQALTAELSPNVVAQRPDMATVRTGTREELAAFWVTLDAINFGSGWFPTLRKREGRSGYSTIAAGVRERFSERGPWSARELMQIEPDEVAHTLAQDPDHELMGLFAESLNDLGTRLIAEHSGSFTALVDSARGSAITLATQLGAWDCFSDTSRYDELELAFLKRAQITAADLHRVGVCRFADLDRLTMFADNLVPHVLRLDGVLEFEPELVGRIERGELIAHGSPEEVEIRACAVHAVELIVAARPGAAADVDELLWLRGQEPRYKSSPRHRSRCTAY